MRADAGSAMQCWHINTCSWRLDCFLMPFQVQNVCVQFLHALISKLIYTEYKVLLNSPLTNKQKKKGNRGKYWKTKASSKAFDHFLGIYSRGTPERLPVRKWPYMPSGELKCCCGYIKIVNEWSGRDSIISVCADVGHVQSCLTQCLLHFTFGDPRQRVRGGDLDL